MALCRSAIHVARDRFRGDDGRGLLFQLREVVLERLRLRLQGLQVDLDLRQQQVEGVDEGDRRAGVWDVGAGFRQEGGDVGVAPPTFVQQDAGHPGDHAGLELLDPALVEFGPRAVRAAHAPDGRLGQHRPPRPRRPHAATTVPPFISTTFSVRISTSAMNRASPLVEASPLSTFGNARPRGFPQAWPTSSNPSKAIGGTYEQPGAVRKPWLGARSRPTPTTFFRPS